MNGVKRRMIRWRARGIQAAVLFLLLMQFASGAQAEVRAQIDRNQVYEGDNVTLSIEVDRRQAGDNPDLTPLEKDFRILGTSTRSQFQIINGRQFNSFQWIVQLLPLRRGTITVPPITVGSEQTEPLSLRVAEVPEQADGAMAEEIFLEVELQPDGASSYVQQQAGYTVRLFHAVPLHDGSLTDPAPADAVVERLGEDRSYQSSRNGKKYQVIERRYAIFPEKSGELRIPPVVFDGHVSARRGSGQARRRSGSMIDQFFGSDFFDDDFFAGTPFGSPGQPVKLRSEALELRVKPIPDGFTGQEWLPSEQLVLHDSWTDGPPEFRAGEPVSRKITIEAKGLAASQLPLIAVTDTAGLQVYPDRPVSDSRTDGVWVFGRSVQQLGYMPEAAGRLTIPEITLSWWDTKADKQREARLPAWEINVLPGAGGTAATLPRAAQTASVAEEPDEPASTVADPRTEPLADTISTFLEQHWRWLAAAAGAVLLIVFLFVMRRRQGPRAASEPGKTESAPVHEPPPDLSASRRTLEVACRNNDAQAAAQALLEWGAARWPEDPPLSLGGLAGRIAHGAEQVRALDKCLYASGHPHWQGMDLLEALGPELGKTGDSRVQPKETLAPLYPQHS